MGKIAFVFSGQGAQYSGMGKSLYEHSPAAAKVFQTADRLRRDTSVQCFTADKEILSETINTQPCLFCVDLAAAEALKENGIQPDMIAGFSLGEIPALAFSGALSVEDAFTLVCRRAEFMEACTKETKGAMAAVLGLDAPQVEALCQKAGKVYPVNYNGDTQIVAAGDPAGIEQLAVLVKEAGGKSRMLAVSGAFHSPFMDQAAEQMAEYIKALSFRTPDIALYANVTAKPYTEKELIAQQINHPVRWTQTIRQMIEDGADTFIETGAGKVLTGLIKKISKDVKVLHVEDKETLEEVLADVKG